MEIKKFEVGGKIITKGHCTCVTARVCSKEFDLFLQTTFINTTENKNDISITEDKVIKLINEAVEVKIVDDSDGVYLYIETKDYTVIIVIKEDEGGN